MPRLLVAGGALALLGSAASAQEADLSRCLAIADIAKRVECYDAIARAQAGDAARAPQPSPSAEPQARAAPQPAPAVADSERRAEFGLSAAEREQRLPSEQRQLDELGAVVASARVVGPGYWEFAMQDGSVWRLAEVRRSFRPPRAGDAVELKRGSLGAYFLQAGGQAGIRIKRVS